MADQSRVLMQADRIKSELQVLRSTEALSQPTYAHIVQSLELLKKEFVRSHSKETIARYKLQSRAEQLPELERAAKILFTLRGALPVCSEEDLGDVERSIADTANLLAKQLKDLMQTETQPI